MGRVCLTQRDGNEAKPNPDRIAGALVPLRLLQNFQDFEGINLSSLSSASLSWNPVNQESPGNMTAQTQKPESHLRTLGRRGKRPVLGND